MTLGILGGCGPAAGAYFYTRLIEMTAAERDRDHVDVLLCGRASTPDRTAALLGKGCDPLPSLIADGRRLEEGGADFLVLTCHTAHAYLPALRAALHIPILDMISLTLDHAAVNGYATLGVLCSAGTYSARLYDRAAAPYGITIRYPSPGARALLSDSIYGFLKQGRRDGGAAVRTASAELGSRGCRAVVLGCTELSLPSAAPCAALYYRPSGTAAFLPQQIIDPLDLLARRAITLCGKQIKEEYRDATAFFAVGPANCQTAKGRSGHGYHHARL